MKIINILNILWEIINYVFLEVKKLFNIWKLFFLIINGIIKDMFMCWFICVCMCMCKKIVV